MDGTVIDYATYKQGHSDLGKRSLRVEIVAFPTNLTVRIPGKALFSVPWENFVSASRGVIWKEGLDIVGALMLRSIPVLDLLGGASSFHDGFWLYYWDNDIDRRQE